MALSARHPSQGRRVRRRGLTAVPAVGTDAFFGTTAAGQVDPIAIASAQAFGALTILGRVNVTGIPSGQAFGSPSVRYGAITVSGIQSQATVSAPRLIGIVRPSGVVSTEAVGQPSISARIDPLGIASAQNVGVPVIQLGVVKPVGIASEADVGFPTVAQTLIPAPAPTPVPSFPAPPAAIAPAAVRHVRQTRTAIAIRTRHAVRAFSSDRGSVSVGARWRASVRTPVAPQRRRLRYRVPVAVSSSHRTQVRTVTRSAGPTTSSLDVRRRDSPDVEALLLLL